MKKPAAAMKKKRSACMRMRKVMKRPAAAMKRPATVKQTEAETSSKRSWREIVRKEADRKKVHKKKENVQTRARRAARNGLPYRTRGPELVDVAASAYAAEVKSEEAMERADSAHEAADHAHEAADEAKKAAAGARDEE